MTAFEALQHVLAETKRVAEENAQIANDRGAVIIDLRVKLCAANARAEALLQAEVDRCHDLANAWDAAKEQFKREA